MTKPQFVTVGYAYPTSWYANHFHAYDGCWYFYTLDPEYVAANETGPFTSIAQALTEAKKTYPDLSIPMSDIGWIESHGIPIY